MRDGERHRTDGDRCETTREGIERSCSASVVESEVLAWYGGTVAHGAGCHEACAYTVVLHAAGRIANMEEAVVMACTKAGVSERVDTGSGMARGGGGRCAPGMVLCWWVPEK